ncbi:MAG: large conductance mechanosensitive channel protein MscL [Eubacteriales bacterium]|nr:large conductance mechanosensitive channel protein MscL [Eubacteriales bacterium]
MLKEFREFAIKGNVVDLATAVVIGGAFGKIVSSFVNDIIMPAISLLTGKIDFANLFVSLDGKTYQTLADAKAAGASTLNYGNFIVTVVDFIIIAFFIFLVIKQINKMKKKPAPAPAAAPTEKVCPYCQSKVSIKAVKCPFCTSELRD